MPLPSKRKTQNWFKAVLAYVLAFVFILSPLNACLEPRTLSNVIFISAVHSPAKTIGNFLNSTALLILVISFTSIIWIIIQIAAAPSYPAMSVILFLYVYFLSVVRSVSHTRYFIPVLTGIMMSYTSTASVVGVAGDTVSGGGSGFFDYSYLQSTLTAYAIGITISLVINILLFPDTAEKHLNKNLTALFSKLYELSSCIITCLSNTNPSREDYRSELSKRTHLVAGIQTLFGAIDAELEHVAAEIMYSHFSLADYSRLVKSCKSVAAVLFSMNTVLDSPDSVTLIMSKDYEGNISEDMKIVWREFRDSMEAMFDRDGVEDDDEKGAATNDEKVVNIVDAFKRAGDKAVASFRNHQPHLFGRIFDNNYGNLNHSMEASTKEAKKSWEKLLQINYYTLATREFIEELVELQKQREIFNKARCRIRFHINWYIPPAKVLNNLKFGTSFALSRRTIRTWAMVLKNMLLSSNSIYGFKVATAIICLQMIMYSIPDIYKSWYMSGCVGTIVVAITPSMGQTFFGVPLTILGTSFGNSLAFASVSLFGADSYGHLVFCLITGVLFCYIPVFSPQHSALGLLTLLAFANFVCITYVKKDDKSFETPSIHLSKVISVTSIALPFSVLFTLVIYPTLARHVLRKRLSSIFDDLNMFYCKIMTSSIRESAPSLQPLLSLNEEDSDLKTLRNKIFSNIVALDPLMTYASSEPRIQGRFPSEIYYEVIQIMYALLDRLECVRLSVGEKPFDVDIRKVLKTQDLAESRAELQQTVSLLLYIFSSVMLTKLKVPSNLPNASKAREKVIHEFISILLVHSRAVVGERDPMAGIVPLEKSDMLAVLFNTDKWMRLFGTSSAVREVSHTLDRFVPHMKKLFGEYSAVVIDEIEMEDIVSVHSEK